MESSFQKCSLRMYQHPDQDISCEKLGDAVFDTIVSLTTEMFSFSSSFFLLFLVFFVRGVRLGEASLPATPSIFFFFVLVPPFALCELTVVTLVVSSRLSLCINTGEQIFIPRLNT